MRQSKCRDDTTVGSPMVAGLREGEAPAEPHSGEWLALAAARSTGVW